MNPSSLFKYRELNKNSIQSLIDNKVWHSKPESFNDPFDCKFPKVIEHSDEELTKHLNRCAKSQGKQESYTPEFIKKTGRKEYDDMLEGYKKKMANAGVFSLSAAGPTEPLMWAHYADKHYGFCIEYERKPNNSLNCDNCFNVTYTEPEEAIISMLDTFFQEDEIREKAMLKILTSKVKSWSYENEWRLIRFWKDSSSLQDRWYPLGANIMSIYFGLRMPRKDALTILRILNKYTEIKFYQMTQSVERLALEPKPFFFTEEEFKDG